MDTKWMKHAGACSLFLAWLLLASCGGFSSQENTTATPPPVSSQTAYVASTAGLAAYQASDVKPRWSAPIGESPGAVSVSGNLVYVLSSDLLYAFHTGDGSLRWRQQLPYSLDTSAKLLLEQGSLYAINGAHLAALHADSGAIQ